MCCLIFQAGARRGKGSGNPGKPGKRLRLADLQGQFGVGLKEAATRLGICPTTLKACVNVQLCPEHGVCSHAVTGNKRRAGQIWLISCKPDKHTGLTA